MSDQDIDWYGPETSTFGDRLAAARENAGMTQQKLARRLGVRTATLEGWENDVSEPRANKLTMLSGILNVSLPWLLTGQGEGIEHPDDKTTLSPEVGQMLTEIRDLKASMITSAEQLGRLEKKLRLTLKENT